MKLGSLYGKNSSVSRKAIVNREDFRTSGSLSGRNLADGRYAVYSYAEPIFFYTPEAGWTATLRKFSVTTSKHQGFTGGALAVAGIPFNYVPERIKF